MRVVRYKVQRSGRWASFIVVCEFGTENKRNMETIDTCGDGKQQMFACGRARLHLHSTKDSAFITIEDGKISH